MKIIFLDIDGVLNNGFIHDDCGSAIIDRFSIIRLNTLIDAFTKVVLISAWRYMVLNGAMTIVGFDHLMRTHGLKKHSIIDCVCSDEEIPHRLDQIKKWLKGHPEQDVTSFVIIDNIDPTNYYGPFEALRVKPVNGLSGGDVMKANEIFTHFEQLLNKII